MPSFPTNDFALYDPADPTKVILFSAATIATATIRTSTMPDADVTMGGGGGSLVVRKNSGADVGTRPRINLIEGTNITLTVADDAGDDEVDITIEASGGGGGLTHGQVLARTLGA